MVYWKRFRHARALSGEALGCPIWRDGHAVAFDKRKDLKHIAASELNKAFWNELCGSQLARRLGVVDASKASLKKFDDWHMNFYYYLQDHIPFAEFDGKHVLEVGLGYGTVGQRIAASGAHYSGLDIALGPVHMMNDRLAQNELHGAALQGSILDAPFDDETFDWVVATVIGVSPVTVKLIFTPSNVAGNDKSVSN